MNEFGLKEYDANVLLQTKESSDFFDQTVAAGADPQLAANWMNTQVNGYLNDNRVELADIKLTPEHLAAMIKLIKDGTISSKIAKRSLQRQSLMVQTLRNTLKTKVWCSYLIPASWHLWLKRLLITTHNR